MRRGAGEGAGVGVVSAWLVVAVAEVSVLGEAKLSEGVGEGLGCGEDGVVGAVRGF